MVDPVDERALVDRARTDPDAFADLYRAHVERVYRFAWRRLGNREAAEDVVAATFERAWRALPEFQWKDGGFPAWLLRIAANQVTDHIRKESRVTSDRGQRALSVLAPSSSLPAPEDAVDGDDPELRAALGRINPRYAEALSLRYLLGLDPKDAAKALGVSSATFAVVLHRAQTALKKELSR